MTSTEERQFHRRHPSNQKFYRVIAFIMGILGLNTHYWSWYVDPPNRCYALQRRVVVVFVPVAIVSMVAYLTLNYKEHEFSVLASICSIIPFTFNLTLLIATEKNTRYVLYSMMSCALICCTSWALVPVKHNIQNNHSVHNITARLELGIYFWQPFDFEYNIYGYCVSQIIGTYCGFIGTLTWVLFDTTNLAYIFHMTGHIQIMKYDLRTWQNKKFSDEVWEMKLKEITTTYSCITKTLKDAEAAFGLNVSSLYAQNLVQGGLLLYQFTSSGGDMGVMLTYGLMIPLFMGTLLVMSLGLENIRIQADDVPSLLYALPWESMNIHNKKLVQSIIFQVQPTLEYKAAFNIKTGIKPALSIIKTTFSYYVMIKARKEM